MLAGHKLVLLNALLKNVAIEEAQGDDADDRLLRALSAIGSPAARVSSAQRRTRQGILNEIALGIKSLVPLAGIG